MHKHKYHRAGGGMDELDKKQDREHFVSSQESGLTYWRTRLAVSRASSKTMRLIIVFTAHRKMKVDCR